MAKAKKNFHLHFAFTIHDQRDTVMNFMDSITDADVVCTEMSGWADTDEKIIQAVANGRYAIDKALEDLDASGFAGEHNRSIVRPLLERVFDTKKVIFFADVPETETRLRLALDESGSYLEKIENLCTQTFEGKFDNAVRECRVLLAQFFKAHREREELILKRLTQELPKCTAQAPITAGKNDINVAISLGMGHSTMLRGFKKTGFTISRSFPRPIQFLDSTTAALRAMRAVGTLNISEETVARVLFENHVILPSNLWPQVSREVTRLVPHTFSLAEIQALFADYSKAPTPKRIKLITQKALTDRGIPIDSDPVQWIEYVNRVCDERRFPQYVSDTLKSSFEQELKTESQFRKLMRYVKRLGRQFRFG